MNLFIKVTVVLSKGRRRHPSNKSVLWNRSRFVMNCEICVPSVAFILKDFKRMLRQNFGLKVGQSQVLKTFVSELFENEPLCFGKKMCNSCFKIEGEKQKGGYVVPDYTCNSNKVHTVQSMFNLKENMSL